MGESLTLWTSRGAFALYVAALLLSRRAPGAAKLARGLWTTGCVLLFIHVGLAFDHFHHWSHNEAYQDTARQTAVVTGINWGGGLYFNYAMLAVWLTDAAWWWIAPRHYANREPAIAWGFHGFFAFMWFNATVVFGHGLIRWVGLGSFLVLAVFFRRRGQRRNV